MEFLFDLLPLLAIYVLVRVFSRKRNPARPTATLSTEDAAPTARTGFEHLLEALAAAQAEAERTESGAPTIPAIEPATVAADPVPPATSPRIARKKSTPPQPAATVSRGRSIADGGRFYDDETAFDRVAPMHAHDEHGGVDAQGFTTANFVEHGMRSHAPLMPPAPPPPRPASGIAARLRDPKTAREAFEIQMLLERRGRSASEQRRLGASPRRPTR